jgi:hypothetical protein
MIIGRNLCVRRLEGKEMRRNQQSKGGKIFDFGITPSRTDIFKPSHVDT